MSWSKQFLQLEYSVKNTASKVVLNFTNNGFISSPKQSNLKIFYGPENKKSSTAYYYIGFFMT